MNIKQVLESDGHVCWQWGLLGNQGGHFLHSIGQLSSLLNMSALFLLSDMENSDLGETEKQWLASLGHSTGREISNKQNGGLGCYW